MSSNPGGARTDPSMRPTSVSVLVVAGLAAAAVAWLLLEPTRAARADVPAAVGGVLASLALVAAALWLERACRVPEQPDRPGEERSRRD